MCMRAQLHTAAKISLSQNLVTKPRQVLRLFCVLRVAPIALPPFPLSFQFLRNIAACANERTTCAFAYKGRNEDICASCVIQVGDDDEPPSLIYRHSRNYTRTCNECAVCHSVFRIAINWRLRRFTMYPIASISSHDLIISRRNSVLV